MSYYKKLNLPDQPFKDWPGFLAEKLQQPWTPRQDFFDVLSVDQYISDSLRDVLEQHNILPKHFIVFCAGNSVSTMDKRIIHSDIYWDRDRKSWRDIYCGINWELGGSNLFSWWNMEALPKKYPIVAMTPTGPKPHTMYGTDRSHVLNGLHFGNKRLIQGVPAEAQQLAETYIDGATLVRTDVPHATVYNNDRMRFGISLRIDESNISSWDDVLDLFNPLIKE